VNNPTPIPQSAAAALVGDPASFGRVDDSGVVYVRTKDGERAVGSYPGKSNEEALAYFVRKFEVLASEVALTADRLRNGAMLAEDGEEAIKKLRQQVENISPLAQARREAEAARKAAAAAAKAEAKIVAAAEKEKIVVEAESLADSDSWKSTGDRLKVLLDDWKKLARIDKPADEALWKRFSAARNHFDRRRRTHFATLDKERTTIVEKKESLIQQAEKLATSTEWVNTARKFKSLMDEWKATGRASKVDEGKLWNRFKSAQDAFFAAKNADLAKREESFVANQAKKEDLASQAEALLPITNLSSAKKALRDIQDKWEKAGMVPRAAKEKLENRLRAVEKVIRAAAEEESRKSDPVAKKRAQEAVDKLNEAISGYLKQADKFDKAGNTSKATEARAAAEARKLWLVEAEKTLAEFR